MHADKGALGLVIKHMKCHRNWQFVQYAWQHIGLFDFHYFYFHFERVTNVWFYMLILKSKAEDKYTNKQSKMLVIAVFLLVIIITINYIYFLKMILYSLFHIKIIYLNKLFVCNSHWVSSV